MFDLLLYVNMHNNNYQDCPAGSADHPGDVVAVSFTLGLCRANGRSSNSGQQRHGPSCPSFGRLMAAKTMSRYMGLHSQFLLLGLRPPACLLQLLLQKDRMHPCRPFHCRWAGSSEGRMDRLNPPAYDPAWMVSLSSCGNAHVWLQPVCSRWHSVSNRPFGHSQSSCSHLRACPAAPDLQP